MQNDWIVKDGKKLNADVVNGIVIDRFNDASKQWISVIRNNGKIACRTHSVRETAIKNAYKAVSL